MLDDMNEPKFISKITNRVGFMITNIDMLYSAYVKYNLLPAL